MITKFWIVVLIAGMAVSYGAIEWPADQQACRKASERHEDDVLKYLRSVVRSSGKVIRLYYRGACDPKSAAPVPFPFTKVQPPAKGTTGLAAVRDIFRNDKNVTVTEKPVGIIRIWIGKMPSPILGTKLPLVTLEPDEQYNPMLAIGAIQSTKEVEAAMRALEVDKVLALAGGSVVKQPAKRLSHLPPSIKGVTMDQALDVIAKTFQGIVIYGACATPTGPSGERLLWIDFAPASDY